MLFLIGVVLMMDVDVDVVVPNMACMLFSSMKNVAACME